MLKRVSYKVLMKSLKPKGEEKSQWWQGLFPKSSDRIHNENESKRSLPSSRASKTYRIYVWEGGTAQS